jgi:hypothetical protein
LKDELGLPGEPFRDNDTLAARIQMNEHAWAFEKGQRDVLLRRELSR